MKKHQFTPDQITELKQNRFTGEVIYSCDKCTTMKELVEKAVEKKVSLSEVK